MMKSFKFFAMTVVALIIPILSVFSVHANAAGCNVVSHSEDEIRAYVSSHPFDVKKNPTFDKVPQLDGSIIGMLSSETLSEALNALNCMRYIGGLDEVGLNNDYIELAQAASFVNNANGSLSHSPSQPAGVSSSVYNLGYKGAGSSNLGMGHRNPAHSIVNGYMDDSDSSNIDRVGHRRWCLNPTMTQTGFGQVDNSTAMYAFDGSLKDTAVTNVAWPAQNMPIEYFGDDIAWSLSVGRKVSNASVTLTRQSDGKTWSFPGNGYFNVENSNYGQPGCIIFRPDDIEGYSDGDIFNVNINADEENISYTVNFFKLVPCQHNKINKKTVKNADCTHEGEIENYCADCGEFISKETVPMTAHTIITVIGKAPTCTETGENIDKCNICGKIIETVSVPALGHSFGYWTNNTDGVTESRVCSACGETESRTIAVQSSTEISSSKPSSSTKSSSTASSSVKSSSTASSSAKSSSTTSSSVKSSSTASSSAKSSSTTSSSVKSSSTASSSVKSSSAASSSVKSSSTTSSSVKSSSSSTEFIESESDDFTRISTKTLLIIGGTITAAIVAIVVIAVLKRKK